MIYYQLLDVYKQTIALPDCNRYRSISDCIVRDLSSTAARTSGYLPHDSVHPLSTLYSWPEYRRSRGNYFVWEMTIAIQSMSCWTHLNSHRDWRRVIDMESGQRCGNVDKWLLFNIYCKAGNYWLVLTLIELVGLTAN
jgi:hypothetical protein